jgi:hypothetical protein
VAKAWCAWVPGNIAFDRGDDISKIERLMLPNPDCPALIDFSSRLPSKTNEIQHDIRTTTRAAQKKNIEVKWTPHFTGQSWWVANPDGNDSDGFIHIEVMLPFGHRDRRPAFRVYRWQNREFFELHKKIFDEMWNKEAKDAPRIE